MAKHCFTLLEIMIVIGIIAILAALTVGGLQFAGDKSDEAKTIAIMKEFEMALEKYKKDKGVYPILSSDSEIDLSNSEWSNFRTGHYLSGDNSGILRDGYDNAFFYRYPGTRNTGKYDLWSMGADGYHGCKEKSDRGDTNENKYTQYAGEDGSDDICNWRR